MYNDLTLFLFVRPNSEKLQMRLKPFEVEALAKENQADKSESTGNYILDEKLAEEEEMRRMEENPENDNEGDEQLEKVEDEDDEEEDAMPVPQVRLDANGFIILDETTLVRMQNLVCNRITLIFPINRFILCRQSKRAKLSETNPNLQTLASLLNIVTLW